MSCDKELSDTWIWIEVIGFDNLELDYGVGEYIQRTGFVPANVSLLVTAMDFILLHDGIEEEINLPPDMCSRTGHPYNLERNRQEWTNHQIRDLVSELKLHGIKVHLSVFPHYIDDRFHHEWTSDYPELHSVYTTGVVKGAVSVLKRFDNGDWFEDLFIEKLLVTLKDYGFDGWHGCDGFGPLSGGLNIVDFSDDLVDQFAISAGVELPESVSGPFGHEMEGIRKRAAWIWKNNRREWIDFYVDRWTVFWGKVVKSLHSHGQKVIINSSWGRAPFEALYRYGIDYRKIATTGVDGMLVETVAASLSMDPRSNCSASIRHYDFLAMLMLVKASVPDLPLIFLQATQDAADELWDVIHHTPTAFEREMYSLSNVFIANEKRGIKRCVEGPLYCLGDGIKKHEWEWMESWRKLAFSNHPKSVSGATLIWDDDLLDNQLDDYLTTHNWSAHRLLYHLMSAGAPVQQVANLKHLDSLKGAILVLNAHQLSAEKLELIDRYENGPIITIGDSAMAKTLSGVDLEFKSLLPDNNFRCQVRNCESTKDMKVEVSTKDDNEILEDLPADFEPQGYWDNLHYKPISKSFIQGCADIIAKVSDFPELGGEFKNDVTMMLDESEDGSLRLALKNMGSTYAYPEIDFHRKISDVKVLTPFPGAPPKLDGTRLSTVIPAKGIAVFRICF